MAVLRISTLTDPRKVVVVFVSAAVVIVKKENGKTYLDADKWDYSQTTGKYRNQFLGETKKETEAKIKSGEYVLTNLN